MHQIKHQINNGEPTHYYVGVETDFKYENTGLMLATAEDVGIFLRALNDGSVFNEGEQEIYSSIYVYEHTGLLPGYQSIERLIKKWIGNSC